MPSRVNSDWDVSHRHKWYNLQGGTALLHTCRAGHPEVVRLFLRNHADTSIATHNEEIPIHWLVSFDDRDIELIANSSSKMKPSLTQMGQQGEYVTLYFQEESMSTANCLERLCIGLCTTIGLRWWSYYSTTVGILWRFNTLILSTGQRMCVIMNVFE